MRIEVKQISKLMVAGILFSLATVILGVLSILDIENWIIRIIMQASLCLSLLFNGIHILVFRKSRKTGYFLLGVSALNLFVMIFTIFVGFQIGKL